MMALFVANQGITIMGGCGTRHLNMCPSPVFLHSCTLDFEQHIAA